MISEFKKGLFTGLGICAVVGSTASGWLYNTRESNRSITVDTQDISAVVTYSPWIWERYEKQRLEALFTASLHGQASNLLLGPDIEPLATMMDMRCQEYKGQVLFGK